MYYKGRKIERPTTFSLDFHGYGEGIRSEIGASLSRKKRQKVLDVGTGFGSTASFLTTRLPKGSKIWTVDPSKEMLKEVRKKLAEDGTGPIPIEFMQADASKLDFEDDFFDVIVSVMVLHHLENLGKVLKELSRVLKRGGRLLLADYVPDAGRYLVFEKRHAVSDFYPPEKVAKIIRKLGLRVKIRRARLWYLIDAKK